MKIKAIALTLLLGTAAASAQIAPSPAPTPGSGESMQSSSGLFKPESGNLTFEMNFSPFGPSPINLSYLRTRLFISDDLALRIGLSVEMNSTKDSDVPATDVLVETNTSSFLYDLRPGIEKHFSGTERLSPYIGGELILTGQSASSEEITTNKSNNTTNVSTIKVDGDNGTKGGYFAFGVGIVAGCDFYFARRIYMGLEAGFGLTTTSMSDVTVTVTDNAGVSTSVTTANGSSMRLGPTANTAIRIGFVF